MAILFDSKFMDLLTLLALLISLGYYYVQRAYGYWKRRNINSLQPSFPFGNFGDVINQKVNGSLLASEIYNRTVGRFIGMYAFFKPILILRDPDIIRTVMIKDFQHFRDRGVFSDEDNDPLTGHLFNMTGDKWKALRAQLTPTFTTGKLRAMFSTLVECGEPLTRFMDKAAANEDTIEMRELMAQYTTNIIASVAFGIEVDAIDKPDTPFRKMGRKVFSPSSKETLLNTVAFMFPKLFKLLKLKITNPDVEEFMMSVVKQNMDYREQNNVSRKDFFQLLVQLRNVGKVQMDGEWDTRINAEKKFSMTQCAAQSFVFFIAGFETSSTTITFCLYELAKNPDLQLNVQREIDEILQKQAGHITFEAVQEMKYLESCIDEALRMHPPVPLLIRECTKEWQIPGTDTILEKGQLLFLPVYALQHDAQYYPEPETFNPDRFNAENSAGKSIVDMPYLPFGDGPRACIGLRMGKMQVKVGLILLLRNYHFQLAGNTLKPLEMVKAGGLLAPIGGIQLRVSKRTV